MEYTKIRVVRNLAELKGLMRKMSHEKKSYKIELELTPTIVEYLIGAKDDNQRRFDQKHATCTRKQIEEVGWDDDNAFIKIHYSGKVIDGQHRLNAIHLIQKTEPQFAPINLCVMNASDIQRVITDTGKARSAADNICIGGTPVTAKQLSAVRAYILKGTRGVRLTVLDQKKEIEKPSWQLFFSLFPNSLFLSCGGVSKALTAPMLRALYEFMLRAGSEGLTELLAKVTDMNNTDGWVRELRERIIHPEDFAVSASKSMKRLVPDQPLSAHSRNLVVYSMFVRCLEGYLKGKSYPSKTNRALMTWYDWSTEPKYFLKEK